MSDGIVFWEGRFLPESEALVPIADSALLFGEGVFTTLRVCDGRVAWLERHWERLRLSCGWLGLPFSARTEDLFELIRRRGEGIWRGKVCVTGGGRLLMRLDPAPERSLDPINVGLYPYPIGGEIYRHKSVSLLERRLIAREAKERGWDDCLTQTESGVLLEAGYSNLFWIEGERLYTPDWERLPLLHGVYLQAVLELGYTVERVVCQLGEIPSTAHLFLCNTLRGIAPIASIGERICPVDTRLCGLLVEALNRLERGSLCGSSPLPLADLAIEDRNAGKDG